MPRGVISHIRRLRAHCRRRNGGRGLRRTFTLIEGLNQQCQTTTHKDSNGWQFTSNCKVGQTEQNRAYLATKAAKSGHLL